MTDPFTSQGLADRTRVIARDGSANSFIPKLQVDELVIGGVRIFASQGTRAANGRLTFKGRDGNSCEIELKPADDCHGKGVMTQILWYSEYQPDSFKRYGTSLVVDDNGGERVEVDSSAHESTYAMPVYMPVVGARSRSDGTDVPNTAKYSFSYFQNGTHELHLEDDNLRVELASVVEAWLQNDKTLIHARRKTPTGWEQIQFNNL